MILPLLGVFFSMVPRAIAQGFMNNNNVSNEALSMFRGGDSPYATFVTIGIIALSYFSINFIMLAWLKNDQFARTGKELSPTQKWTIPFFGLIDVIIYIRKRPEGELALCFHCGKQKLRNVDVCYYCGKGDIDHQRHAKGGRHGGAKVTAAMNKAVDAQGDKKSSVSHGGAVATDATGASGAGGGEAEIVYELDPAEQLRAAVYTLESMPDAAILLSKIGTIEAVNDIFEKMTGYLQTDLKGNNIKIFLPTLFKHEKNNEVHTKFKLAIGREYPFSVHALIHTKSDEQHEVIFNMSYLKDVIGQPLHSVICLHDITELRNKEREEHNASYATISGIAQIIATMINIKDDYTADHQKRVGKLAYAIAKQMGLGEEVARGAHIAGLVHDCGMYRVPSAILTKPDKLTIEEFEIVKNHSLYGYQLLKDIAFPWPVAQAVLQHHERLNGSGYPAGTPNKDIIIEAKILMVADMVEAMSHKRPFRTAFDLQAAMKTVHDGKGVLFEPKVVDACIKVLSATIKK